MSSIILTDMEESKFTASTMLVFFVLKEQSKHHEDGRVPVARVWFTEHFGITDKAARVALASLQKAGWITIQRRPGTYNFARITYRQEGRPKGQLEGQQKGQRFTVLETEEKGQRKGQLEGQQKGLPGVAVVVDVVPAVGTAVSLSGVKEVLKLTAAKKPAASEPERLEEKIPGFRKLCDHITATWTEKKKGLKPAWSKDSWVQLSRQTTRFQCHEIAGLWDEYLRSVDSFVVNVQAYSLVWFATRTIDALVDVTDYKKMGRAYEDFWNGKGPDPRTRAIYTPREIASKTPPRASAPKPKPMEPEPEDTPEIIADRHRTMVKALGPRSCKIKPCAVCEPAVAPGKELAVAGPEKRPSPF
jgi:hypothetical protein